MSDVKVCGGKLLADNGKLLSLTGPSKLYCESSNRSDELAVMRPAGDRDVALCTARSDCPQSCWTSGHAERQGASSGARASD